MSVKKVNKIVQLAQKGEQNIFFLKQTINSEQFVCASLGLMQQNLAQLGAVKRRVWRIGVGGRPAWWIEIFHAFCSAVFNPLFSISSLYVCHK